MPDTTDQPSITPAPGPHGGPALVAHRGYALHYPENTLESIRAALEAGAAYVELDIQLTADRVPVLPGGETTRLGAAFAGVRLPALAEVVTLLQGWPQTVVFVELKRASLLRFGTREVVALVIDVLTPVHERSVVISYSPEAVTEARRQGVRAVGWILEAWTAETRADAERLQPDYLLCNRTKLPATQPLWPGPWRWVIYEVNDAGTARRLAERGVDLVETNAIGEMLGAEAAGG